MIQVQMTYAHYAISHLKIYNFDILDKLGDFLTTLNISFGVIYSL
jgi:hypothetical protein